MKYVVKKDQKKRSIYTKTEREKKLLKALVHNQNCQKVLRWQAQLQLSDFPRRGSRSQIQNRCILTGRARFLVRGFNLSRFMIRKYAQEGLIPGIKKACW